MSSATNAFQDLGYFCVDNLPVTMLPTFGRLVSDDEEKGIQRAALVIDIREGGFLVDFEKQLEALRAAGLKVSVCWRRSKTSASGWRRSERMPTRLSIPRTTRFTRCVASCSTGLVLTVR